MFSKLEALIADVRLLKQRRDEINATLQRQKAQLVKTQDLVKMETEALEYYKKAADLLQYQRLEDLISFVNDALEYVFYDEEYELRIELSDKYSKALTLYLYDGKKDLIKPLRKGNGRGVKAVACYVIYVYFCCEHHADVLWQDETLVNMSPRYVERIFNYVKLVCETRGISQIMISQDSRFMKYGHIMYTMDHGKLEKEEV